MKLHVTAGFCGHLFSVISHFCRALYLIAVVTDWLSFLLVVHLAGQEAVTLPAGEAAGVILLPHGLDGGGVGGDGFMAEGANV